MPLFKVRIKKIEVWYPEIIVEAENLEEAMKYCRFCNNWQDDSSLDNADFADQTKYLPIDGHEIFSVKELPSDYEANSFPWNSIREIREILDK